MPTALNACTASLEPHAPELLRKLAPPRTVIHVGAGAGAGFMHQWWQWDVPNASIIDADANPLRWADLLIADRPGWRVFNAVVGETDDQTNFYRASKSGRGRPHSRHGALPLLDIRLHAIA